MRGLLVLLLFVPGAPLLAACAPPDPGVVELSVLSFNLRHNVDCYEERMELIADGIAALAPDVIGLQEIEIAAEQGEWLDDMLLERGLDYELRQLGKSGLAGALTGEGIGVMSLHEVVSVERLDLSEGRVTLLAEIALGDTTIAFANTHLDAAAGDAVRAEQSLDTLAGLEAVRANADASVLVGDFNSDPADEAVVAVTSAGLSDTWAALHGDDDGFTSGIALAKDGAPQSASRRIDYVFTDGEALSGEVVMDVPRDDGLYPSDHLGVLARLRVERE